MAGNKGDKRRVYCFSGKLVFSHGRGPKVSPPDSISILCCQITSWPLNLVPSSPQILLFQIALSLSQHRLAKRNLSAKISPNDHNMIVFITPRYVGSRGRLSIAQMDIFRVSFSGNLYFNDSTDQWEIFSRSFASHKN